MKKQYKEIGFFRRPYQVLSFQQKKKTFFFIRTLNKKKKILYFEFNKNNFFSKDIKNKFENSLLQKYNENFFFEVDKKGLKINIRKLNGNLFKSLSSSKNKLQIEHILFDNFKKNLLVLDSKFNQLLTFNFSNKNILKKTTKIRKNQLDLEGSTLEKLDQFRFIFSNQKNELFILDNKFQIIKKVSKDKRDGPYSFRSIKSIKLNNKTIAICDYLNHKIKFYNQNFKYLFSVGGKGIEKYKLDLPNNLDTLNNHFILSDSQNDRILRISNSGKISTIIKPKFIKEDLRRPIKILKNNKNLYVLDRDNSRIAVFNLNLKYKNNIKLKKYINGKPNSFCLMNVRNKNFLAILYRFSSLKNKILIYDLAGNYHSKIILNLKDAQDLESFDTNIIISDTNNRRLVLYDLISKKIFIKNLCKYTNNNKLLTKTVTWDKVGNIYTADFEKCIILKFNINLDLIEKIDFSKLKKDLKVIRGIIVKDKYIFILNRSIKPLLAYDLIQKKFITKKHFYKIQKLHNPTSLILFKKDAYVCDKENDRVVRLKNFIY